MVNATLGFLGIVGGGVMGTLLGSLVGFLKTREQRALWRRASKKTPAKTKVRCDHEIRYLRTAKSKAEQVWLRSLAVHHPTRAGRGFT